VHIAGGGHHHRLSRFRSLLGIANSSSFAFRTKPIDIAEVERKLGVSYPIEGTVRRVGNHVRITVQLIDAASGVHPWADVTTMTSATPSRCRTRSHKRSFRP
jgi:TolB-like protein